MARRAAREARGAQCVLRSLRVWDDFDAVTRQWGHRGRSDAATRQTLHGNSAISLSTATPLPNLWKVDWGSAINFKRSDGGRSSGVYFVALPDERIVVLKPDEELVSDYCGSLLASSLGVAQPDMRLVRLSDPEGREIVRTLKRLEEAKPRSERTQVTPATGYHDRPTLPATD